MMMTRVKKVMEAVVKMRKMMKVMLAYVDDDKGEDKEEYDGDDDINIYYECDEDEDDYWADNDKDGVGISNGKNYDI